jgi:hypothetical protein
MVRSSSRGMGSGLVEALTGGATGAIAQAGISRLAGRTPGPRRWGRWKPHSVQRGSCSSMLTATVALASGRRGDRGRARFASLVTAPVSTKSISRPPHCEQTSRLCQSSTGASAPYRRASSAASGSIRCRQSRHQTTIRAPAAAVPPSVAGGPGSRDFTDAQRSVTAPSSG